MSESKGCVRCRKSHTREGGLCPKCYERAIRPPLILRVKWHLGTMGSNVKDVFNGVRNTLKRVRDVLRKVKEEHSLAVEVTNYVLYFLGIVYGIVFTAYLTTYVHPNWFLLYPVVFFLALASPLYILGKLLVSLQMSTEVGG